MPPFQPHPHKAEAIEMLRNGASQGDVLRAFPDLNIRTIARYSAELKNPKQVRQTAGAGTRSGLNTVPVAPAPKPEPEEEASLGQAASQPSAGGEPPRPAAQAKQTVLDVIGPTLVNFRFYNDPVQINLAYLEGAYGDFKKIKRLDPTIEDTFEEAVVGSMRYVLNTLRNKVAREVTQQVLSVMEEGDDDARTEAAG